MSVIESMKAKLIPLFENEPVYRAILFGSYAKESADSISDVDLVIDSRGQLIGLDFFRVLDAIVSILGREVDLFEISDILPGSPVHQAILKEGVVIYDREVA